MSRNGKKNGPGRGQRPKGRHKIDWVAAETYFLSLGPARTFTRVGETFGVSDTAVRNHAEPDQWNAQADAFDKHALEIAVDAVLRDRAARIRDVIRLADISVLRTIRDVAAGSLAPSLSDIPGLVKVAELLEGEATDRVDVAEVQVTLRSFLEIALRHLPGQGRPAFLEDVEVAALVADRSRELQREVEAA